MSIQLHICSHSPRRRDLLIEHDVPFNLIDNLLLDEPKIAQDESIEDYIIRLAKLKVMASKQKFEGLILGADTIVHFNQTIFGKPDSVDSAIATLQHLNGQSHQVISAAVVLNTVSGEFYQMVDTATVHFHKCKTDAIVQYVREFHPMDKAGAYGIQDKPPFLKGYDGDYNTILGLPLNALLQLFSSYGIVK